jgi:hypothetical protein
MNDFSLQSFNFEQKVMTLTAINPIFMAYKKTTVKQTIYILILALGLLNCNSLPKKSADHSTLLETADNKIKLHKLEKLFVVGNFDGKGKQDTIFQHSFSRLTKTEIEYSADPFQNEWETVVKWFHDQDINLYLTTNIKNQNTLHLGIAHGLYCLINIGDNNADGKDEIALVIDFLDFSRVNSCKIYSLCNNKWTLLKKFGVHEDSFDFTTVKAPLFTSIKDYLENQNGKWVYMDYSQDGYDNQEDVGKMLTLNLDNCK